MNREDNKTLIAYLAVCLFWGSTYLAIRIGVNAFPPLIFAGVRFLLAGSLMLGYAFFRGFEIPKNRSSILKISAVGLFLLTGGNGCVVFAETMVNSGLASLIVATVPLFMVVIEIIIKTNTKLDLRSWFGLILGFFGVFLLVFPNTGAGTNNITGVLLLLCAALLWAMGSVYSKTFKAEGSIVSQIAIQMLAGGFALFLLGTITGEISKVKFSLVGFEALFYLIIFGSIIGYSCYIYILKKWPAAKAGTYAYVNPVVAVILGAIILNEPLSLKMIISAIVILGGVIIVQTSKK